MRVVICGGPDVTDLALLQRAVQAFETKYGRITEVVSGGAPGADQLSEHWARAQGLPVHQVIVDWAAHGRAAGPLRNQQLADYADGVAFQLGGCIALPGGRATADMVRRAYKTGLMVLDWRQGEPGDMGR